MRGEGRVRWGVPGTYIYKLVKKEIRLYDDDDDREVEINSKLNKYLSRSFFFFISISFFLLVLSSSRYILYGYIPAMLIIIVIIIIIITVDVVDVDVVVIQKINWIFVSLLKNTEKNEEVLDRQYLFN